jgi:hypothetical protein
MQKTLAEYNAIATYPVLTWANDPEFNVLIWLQNNRQTQKLARQFERGHFRRWGRICRGRRGQRPSKRQ